MKLEGVCLCFLDTPLYKGGVPWVFLYQSSHALHEAIREAGFSSCWTSLIKIQLSLQLYSRVGNRVLPLKIGSGNITFKFTFSKFLAIPDNA